MSILEVRVVVAYGDRHWENVFHVDDVEGAGDIAAVATALHGFFTARTISQYIIQRIVWRVLGTSDEFTEAVFNTAGLVDVGTGDAMPLWNTVKVLLVGGIGRPGIKYLRGMIFGDSLSGDAGLLDSALVLAIQEEWDTMQNAVETAGCHLVYGAANKLAVSGVVQNLVQMRQQHRKRRRSV